MGSIKIENSAAQLSLSVLQRVALIETDCKMDPTGTEPALSKEM